MDKALQTQLANIEKRTGKSLAELAALVNGSGLEKHGQMVAMLKATLGMGHGDANTLVHYAKQSPSISTAARAASEPGAAPAASVEAELDRIYAGPKAALRPIHESLMAAITEFGPFEIAPKKTYLSLRRKKQFATIGPATNTNVEVGLNMKDVPATTRLEALPPGGMCQYRVRLGAASEVDAELIGWIRRAFDSAG
jgi:hypothetical protein